MAEMNEIVNEQSPEQESEENRLELTEDAGESVVDMAMEVAASGADHEEQSAPAEGVDEAMAQAMNAAADIPDEEENEQATAPTRRTRDARRTAGTDLSDGIREGLQGRELTQNRTGFSAVWMGMDNAYRRGRILDGVISGVEERERDGRSMVLLSVLYMDKIKVLIPFEQIYRTNPITQNVDLSSEQGRYDYVARQKAMAEKLYGLTTPFVLTEMYLDKDSLQYYAIASRAEALKLIEARNFDKDGSGHRRLEEGMMVDAVITSVGDYSVAVNVGGVDTRIRVPQLTYRYISGPDVLRQMYHVEDKLKVYIDSITDEEDGSHSVRVNARRWELEDAKSRQGLLSLGDQCIGTVTGVFESSRNKGSVQILLYLDQYKIPASSNSISPNRLGLYPQVGDTMRVTVSGFNDNGFVYVHVRKGHGAPNLMRG